MYVTIDQFRAQWSHALAEDFIPAHGEPLITSTHLFGPAEDQLDVSLKRQPTGWQLAQSINADESLLAVAVDHEIDIYNIIDRSFWGTLRGHTGNIEQLTFHPTQPFALVSCSSDDRPRKAPVLRGAGQPEIIFWDVSGVPPVNTEATNSDTIEEAAKQGVEHGLNKLTLSGIGLEPTDTDLQDMRNSLKSAFLELYSLRSVPSKRRLVGRMLDGFQSASASFSPDGNSIIILPGARPNSNSNDKWDIHIVNFATRQLELELVGHRDAIMWASFSPDQKNIGSSAWDGSFRIWNAADGSLRHAFKSDTQNWGAAFSPDSSKFLGTDGHGVAQIWDLSTGRVIWRHESKCWARYLDWAPDGAHIAIGIERRGKVAIFDVGHIEGEEPIADAVPIQTRALSIAHLPEDMQKLSGGFLTVGGVRFLKSRPRRLVYTTRLDHSVEVYDMEEGRKWRLAPEYTTNDSKFPVDWTYLESSDRLVATTATAVKFFVLADLT